ncbi:uncharacterized protein LOC127837796 isoform X2 [Dreissena polymorpha]|uniref:Uncharacterized protein n=1 Tax=Dreissena polymorpha TaxID=45954 RepID=A0A9D4F8D4_DREPO|nr:uncharacterized protein LOC127837796 isoform X2 [Dreissena polymorpha]KAH3793171.1 hypothetical protein DPMN_146676 [Dreissena polymorpha]
MRWLLSYLINVLEKGFFPSFYVEGSNHICHFTKEDCAAHIELFGKIQRNPANFVKVVVDNELEYNRLTMREDSFKTIQDPKNINSFTWMQLIKLTSASQSELDGYDPDAIVNRGFDAYRQLHLVDPFNTTPHDNVYIGTTITMKELRNVEVFLQTVTQLEMNLFAVLETDIDNEIVHFSEEWMLEETLKKLYPQYDKTADLAYGDHALAVAKLRLKYYRSVYHALCGMLKIACYQKDAAFGNYDVRYIVHLVKELINYFRFTDENVDDLFHSLFFFCHFTRLRHHRLTITDQMLRSIREFLQEADILMTVYFNTRLSYPQPYIVTGIVDLLGECFPRRTETGNAGGCPPCRSAVS